jgi:hypothetical protein
MRLEEVARVDYSARLKPRYKWYVFAADETGKKKSIIEKGESSWTNAMWAAQDWTKLIEIKKFLKDVSKSPWLSSLILRIK